jgi:predicted nucleic acid-binding protein
MPPASHERGPDFVCLDATQLIAFNEAGELATLGAWFPRAFTPEVVFEEEIRPHLARYPQAQQILNAPWLEAVPVESGQGLQLVANLLTRWKSPPERDRGEAEVIALCRDYGWTAILDDDQGRVAARGKNISVPSAMMLTVILAASAYELIKPRDAWRLHVAVDEARKRAGAGSFSYLTSSDTHRPAFMDCVNAFRHIREQQGNPNWPQILATRGLDETIRIVRRDGFKRPRP